MRHRSELKPAARPWIPHYDPGVPPSIEYPEHTLHAFLERAAVRFPERACTVLDDTVISYAQMNDMAGRLALGLAALGVKKGDRVGILLPNLPQFVMAFYGILSAGAVVVATNPLFTRDEIVHQLKDSGIEVIFVLEDLYGMLSSARNAAGLRKLIVVRPASAMPGLEGGRGEASRNSAVTSIAATGEVDLEFEHLLLAPSTAKPDISPVFPDDLALFQYSGGTTGVSKAAVATHRSVVANTIQFRRWLVTLESGREVVLMAIPLYHAYGMVAGMSLGVSLGATLALVPNPRDVALLLATIRRWRPTVFPGVPALYSAISSQADVSSGIVDLGSIRVCISGSTSLMRETKQRFEELSGGTICEGYGLSEAPVVTHCNPLLGVNKIGSIGMPMPDVWCRIVNPGNGELDVGPEESGELILRGPQVMQRYHNMPSETTQVLRTLSDGHTWLFTGDIVHMDQDGYFFVVDRKKELIKPGGFQVWPREVEEALSSHPAVLEVGVAGVPDLERGEAVKAWVVLKPGAAATANDLRTWCRDSLAPYKVPSWIVFRDRLPRSNVGKILRRELAREHRESSNPNE